MSISSPSPPSPMVDESATTSLSSFPVHSYSNYNHKSVALHLTNVFLTGKLGSSRTEPNPADDSIFVSLLTTLPWSILLVQSLWSIIVTLLAHWLSPDDVSNTLSTAYWTSRLVISGSIIYAVGWALFVLLGFFIREASNRYWEALLQWHNLSAYLYQIVRHLKQIYPPGTWHTGDLERIISHLVAYPICLKMHLRGERHRDQLEMILDEKDVDDVVSADFMHLHCMRVVRAYSSVAEDDAPIAFDCVNATKTPAGWGTRYLLMELVDYVDQQADSLMRIASFRPAVGYVNHLRIFLYIWLFFLPLGIVQTSGWFTILWALIISYGIGMLFNIARALNNPFGFDAQDIKLNHLAAETGLQVLDGYARNQMDITSLIRKDHVTPSWLEQPLLIPGESVVKSNMKSKLKSRFNLRKFLPDISIRFDKTVMLCLLIFIAWSAFVIIISWKYPGDSEQTGCRWWCVYIPIDTGITSYVSLGVFLLLGFWMNDAYRRYWRGLQLWQSDIRTDVENSAFQFAIMCKQGTWHSRDRERLFSHLAALPYAAKLHLRGSKDVHEMEKILSPQDIAAFNEADDVFKHCMNVIYAYLNSVDAAHPETCRLPESPLVTSIYTLGWALWDIEKAVQECSALNKFPMSPSFTIHLKVFTFFWLAVLPASLVQFNGFLGFLYILPIGYSIINLIKIGMDLADPFGYDKDDIPLDLLCDEMRDKLHEIYQDTLQGTIGFVHQSDYDRETFIPRLCSQSPAPDISDMTEEETQSESKTLEKQQTEILSSTGTTEEVKKEKEPKPTGNFAVGKLKALHSKIPNMSQNSNSPVFRAIKKFFDSFPSTPLRPFIAAVVWTIVALLLSFGLSRIWEKEKREACRAWCSPIDVSGDVVANIGFALFMILAFRATDAIGRYDDGAMQLFDMELHLRTLAVEVVQVYHDGQFHEKDKERIIAHIVQIPLCFRDILLNIDRTSTDDREGFLSGDDRVAFESSRNPMEHLLQTLSAYVYLEDSTTREGHPGMSDFRIPGPIRFTCMSRLTSIRVIINNILGIKRFPVIASYRSHQYLFTALWLMLLPLAMAPYTGFFTLLWTPLISYGVLGLEEIAVRLVDPFGSDSADIPVDEMCTNAAASVVEAVNAVKWGCDYHIRASPPDGDPRLGTRLIGKEASHQYTLAHFDEFESSSNLSRNVPREFGAPTKQPKVKPQLFIHLAKSVPWWILLGVLGWTILATIVSYISRDRSDKIFARWWQSGLSVNISVATYVSFAAFLVLGFYVQAAFARYNSAGHIWVDELGSNCHALAAQSFSLFEDNTLHEGDKLRMVAHIAALPLVLKNELRGSRDVREVKGLLSYEDIARIQCAESMASHCVDVIRSYFIALISRKDLLSKTVVFGNRVLFFKVGILGLERLIRSLKFLRSFDIAPGFLALLNALLGIWFVILPFAISEISGWFTILWVPIIAYGLLGMHAIASELQFPFGNDLNDLDLDEMAEFIVADVLNVQKRYHRRSASLVHESEIIETWTETHTDSTGSLDPIAEKRKKKKTYRDRAVTLFHLGHNAFSLKFTVAVLLWTILCVVAAWLVSKNFPFSDEVIADCGQWFCSRIAIGSAIGEYIGFALFLLLGFRLYDSHWRYVSALRIWRDGIIGTTNMLANRMFESYHDNVYHNEDRERIAAHMAAFAVAVCERLRKEDYEERYREILSNRDVEELLKSKQREEYCMDVVQSYLTEGDFMEVREGVVHPAGSNEHWMIMYYVHKLRRTAKECIEIVEVPLPYGYVQHLRIFFVIWIMLLPLGLVEQTGWLTILWIPFITYGVYGVVKWADELSNPFGHDLSDVPLEDLVKEVKEMTKINLVVFRNGAEALMKDDRSGFPVARRENWE